MKKLILNILIYIFSFNIYNCPAQWVQMTNGITSNQTVISFVKNGNSILAGTYRGVFNTNNNGESWTAVNNGFIKNTAYVPGIVTIGSDLFAATWGDGVYSSTNNGSNWNAVNNGLTDPVVFAIISKGNDLFAGTYGSGVFHSSDSGNNWSAVNNGLTNHIITTLFTSGKNIFAGTGFPNGGIFRSVDNGESWNKAGTIPDVAMTFAQSGNNLFAGDYGSGVFLSTDNGDNWTSAGLNDQYILSLSVSGNNLFAGTLDSGIYLSTNNGSTWINKNQGFTTIPDVNSLFLTENYIFAGTSYQSVWRRDLSEVTGIQNISGNMPDEFSLLQNYPNPFNPETHIKFIIPSNVNGQTSNVRLYVYDVSGREVVKLVNEKLSPGRYEVGFEGKILPSGVYFYKLSAGDFSETKRMVLLK